MDLQFRAFLEFSVLVSSSILAELEATHERAKFQAGAEALLRDAPRPGCPATFTPGRICQIVAVACEKPAETSQRLTSHWTPRELADEAAKRSIVASISARHVGRFLESGGLAAPQGPVLAHQRAG